MSSTPAVRDESDCYLDGLTGGVLRIRECSDCGHLGPPAAATCRRCFSTNLRWIDSAGVGIVVAAIVDHRVPDGPRVLVLVELDEGPWIMAQLLDTQSAPPSDTLVHLHVRTSEAAEADPVPAFGIP